MRKWIAYRICRIIGHTEPDWKPFYTAWYGANHMETGYCTRCWRVIRERIVR